MADCCTPGTGFPTASSMEAIATNNPVIWEEICMIQQAILAAASNCQTGGGQFCTTVGGNTPMTYISGITSVTVNNGGSGYFVDTPAVLFTPPIGSSGTGATAAITTNGGSITGISLSSGGTGYQPISSTMTVTSLTGTGVTVLPLVNSAGNISGVNILSGGTGYVIGDTVTATRAVIANSAYVDAVFLITTVGISGEIINIAVLNSGSGYQPSVTTINIVSTLNPSIIYPTGVAFNATVNTDSSGVILNVNIINSGAGFADIPPNLVITNAGSGATTLVTLTGTSVSSISILTPGTGYVGTISGQILNPSTASLPNPPANPAVVTVNTAANTFGTNPNLYWQVWAGTTTNTPIQMQENTVLSYFAGLGYTISIQSNPTTGSTIQWLVCW